VFAGKRAFRLLPALTLNIVVISFWLGASVGSSSIVQWLSGGHIQLPPYNNGVLWSLGYEEFFYAALAVLFSLGCYKRPWIIWILWGLGVAVSLWSQTQPQFVSDRANLMSAFFAGNLLYIYRDNLRSRVGWVPHAVLLCAMILKYGFFVYGQTTPFVIVLPPLFVWAAFAGWQIPMPKRWPDLSYGIYLWHIPVVWFLSRWPQFTFGQPIVALVVGATACAALSWYIVEVPTSKIGRRWVERLSGVGRGAGIGGVAITEK
jgi:peptidoglycan/LPS O-acetylase OafA/YrhL